MQCGRPRVEDSWQKTAMGDSIGIAWSKVSMNVLLTYNSIWGCQEWAVIMSNNVKGCYNRIAHVVVSLVLQKLKVPKLAIDSMLETIQTMDHYVRTAFGVSEKCYGLSEGPPPQGILQGNGVDPAGWSAIAALLISIIAKKGSGYRQWTLIKQRVVTLSCLPSLTTQTLSIPSRIPLFPPNRS